MLTGGRLDLHPAVRDGGFLDVRLAVDGIRIQPQGHVGLIPVNDRLVLEVVPRVPLSNLAHLMEATEHFPKQLRDVIRLYDTGGALYPSLVAVYATAMRTLLDTVTTNGLYREYEMVEESTSFPRGRILVGRTMSRELARGVRHRASVAYFHRTVDNEINRCVLLAVHQLAALVVAAGTTLPGATRSAANRDLNACAQVLAGVTLDYHEAFLGNPMVTGHAPLPTLRSYYRPLLDLALTVIGRRALVVDRAGERLLLPSLVVEMAHLFEKYLRVELARVLTERSWNGVVLDGNLDPPSGGARSLTRDGVYVRATPDIVIEREDGAVLVVEVKYKPAKHRPDRDDLNQAVAYGHAYGAAAVVLAQPRADDVVPKGLRALGFVGDLPVYQYVFDLNAADLSAAEDEFADALLPLMELRTQPVVV